MSTKFTTWPNLYRYRPAIIVLGALAAGYAIYYHHISNNAEPSNPGLHRSNAVRRRRSDAHPSAQSESEMPRLDRDATERETVADSNNESSIDDEHDSDPGDKGSQNLLKLLYRIAEDQNRREGYVHRGICCNACGTVPIRGIRYSCMNCPDFDLCEACEASQPHIKTHIFFKLRIPRMHLGHEPQPVKYPGKNVLHNRPLDDHTVKRWHKRTGYSSSEIEGYWDQFQCLAGAEWPEDPSGHCFAIDRRSFEQLFVPANSSRPPPPNLIYDRVFSFYDTDNNNLIGFEEFITGLSYLNRKDSKLKWKRIFKGFDVDGDGYVSRKDFLRMFRAHYALTKRMTGELIGIMEEEGNNEEAVQELITSGYPISSGFHQSTSGGPTSRAGEGKSLDLYGDSIIHDQKGALDDGYQADQNIQEIDAQLAEEVDLVWKSDYKAIPIRDIIAKIRDDAWPPDMLTTDPVRTAASIDYLRSIHDEKLQQKIRWTNLCIWAKFWRNREAWRLRSSKDQAKRRIFGQSERASSVTVQDKGFQLKGAFTCFSGTGTDHRYWRSSRFQNKAEFSERFTHLINSLGWPILEVEEFGAELLHMFEEGWTTNEISKTLEGYTVQQTEATDFVFDFSKLMQEFIPDELQPEELKSPKSPARRSRSSSKVRFEDGLATDDDDPDTRSVTSVSSRSIPVNERWGGFEIPEPEEDMGGDVLYQITQEALNEVIDSIFKSREDLWLEAQATKRQRNHHRAAICKVARSCRPNIIQRYLHSFLKQSHFKIDCLPPSKDVWSDAMHFYRFLDSIGGNDSHYLGRYKSEQCPSCSERFHFGQCCKDCGITTASAVYFHQQQQAMDKEKCSFCAERGKSSDVGQDEYCGNCGYPSSHQAATDEWLWTVLSAGQMLPWGYHPKTQVYAHMFKCKDCSMLSQLVDSTITDGKRCQLHKEAANLEQFLYANGTVPSPKEPGGHQDSQENLIADHAERSAESRPKGLSLEYHTHLQQSMSTEPTIEQRAAKKSLDDLLKFTASGKTDESPKHVNDPEEQHTEKAIGVASSSLETSGATNIEDLPDPTLPQNRPSMVAGSPSASADSSDKGESRKPSDIPFDEVTLKFWAALSILEAEDEQRGGPGLLSEQEFLDIMAGERGESLKFVGEWMRLTAF
ncbi:uncharacterized protein KY384_001982 [Bacidia gigantensis]|uniref:uncharacterized protein n=1 Tax=Bacidia gigantensis TaxID=2732470 RepID=UPI001D05AF0F|nr:uncharacterized protein KY384_001982 [Bacidia gigantensis]KAG8533199.1 hypothetical protein KY384_001982 [Bacidia gigantensis]